MFSLSQENVWFSLGCAAMVSKKLEVAAKAFHWCVSMNPDVSCYGCFVVNVFPQ